MFLGSGVYKTRITTGGGGYAAAPSVSISGGGGTGAQAVAQMAGTVVEAIVITNAGTGYTSNPTVVITAATTDMVGTGAAATAAAIALTTPVCMFQGRFNDMYGVDGYGRGFRWDGDTPIIEPIGISRPLTAATVSASTGSSSNYVRSIAIINGGAGYSSAPTLAFKGGGLTDGDPAHATGRARVINARVVGMTLDTRGSKYSSAPVVEFSGGQATGATLNVHVSGRLLGIDILGTGSGYTASGSSAVTASFTGGGLTDAKVVIGVNDDDGGIASVSILAAGTGATTTPTLTLHAGVGSGATLRPVMAYSVVAVTCATTQAGSGFVAPPAVTFLPEDGGAEVQTSITTEGKLASPLTVLRGGQYEAPPTASVAPTKAKAIAFIDAPMHGVYKCCLRYIDDTVEARQGPIPSSISDLTEITASPNTTTLSWRWSNDGMESRVNKIELWRTSSDQSVMLYRVATVSKVNGVMPNTYLDTLTDDDLLDIERAEFGMMPIVMPSGQLNARRFEPPPIYCAEAVMFQDRAWYAVDTRKEKPNSLWHSEIDEPESVPAEYEIVVQESLGEPDAIVALIPMAASLLIAQSRHLYRLSYVSQPLIDASIRLAEGRGILNARCYALLGGVAYIADGEGVYAYDGGNRQDISVSIDDYWREGRIDFSKKDSFYVSASPLERVVRFFYCQTGDGAHPSRALCYSVATQSWWEETYAQELPCAVGSVRQGRPIELHGGQAGIFVGQSATALDAGLTGTTSIPYALRTGVFPLTADQDRSIGVLYKPTTDSTTLSVNLHYNASETPRANAVYSDRGEGFTQSASGALLDMKLMRSPLGAAPGYAQARYAGRFDDRSAGADRHIAVAMTGARSITEPVIIRGLRISGATT